MTPTHTSDTIVCMPTKKSQRALGILQITLSGFAFGFLGVFGKLAFKHGLSIGELLTSRFITATLIMAAGLAVTNPSKLKIAKRDLIVCAGLGIFGYAVFSTFYFAAIRGVSVATASLLLYTYPVLVAVGASLLLKERLTKSQIAALPLACLGLFVLLSGGFTTPNNAQAVLAGLAAAVCYAAYILVSSKYQKDIDPLTSGFYVMLFASLGLLAFHHPDVTKIPHATREQIGVIIGIAVVCTVTPLVLFLSGLQKLGNTEASLLSTVEPVTAALVGSLLLQERLTYHEWLGGGIVLVALVTTVLGSTAKSSPAKALE